MLSVKSQCHEETYTHFNSEPVNLLIHATIQLANHVAAAQCITIADRALFPPNIRMGKESDAAGFSFCL